MKKILIAIAAIFCLVANTVFAQDTTRLVLSDYEGKAEGKEVPNWVMGAASGKLSSKIFPNMQNKEIFIVSSRANNLEAAKSKANVDILNEICEIMLINASKATAQVQSNINSDDNNLNCKSKSMIIFDNEHFADKRTIASQKGDIFVYTYGSLPDSFEKTYSFWDKFNKVDNKNNIIDTCYEYYLVYTIDEDLWQKIIDDSLNGTKSTFTREPIDIQVNYSEKADQSSYAINVYINPNNKDEFISFFSMKENSYNKYYFNAYRKGYDLDKLRYDTEYYDIRQNLTNFISDVNLSKILKKSYEVWFDVDLKDGSKPFIDYFVQWEIDKDDFLKYMGNTTNNNVYNFTNYN